MTHQIRRYLMVTLLCLWAGPAAAESRTEQEVRRLTELLSIGPGAVIADIGAGDGEYAIALAPAVGESGRIYATELSAEDRETIEQNAKEAGAAQVVVREAQISATGLPRGCCDGAYLRTVYHHLTDPMPFTKDLFETIRPGGRLVVVDFRPTLWLALWTPEGIPEDRGGHGVEPELVTSELEAAGFIHEETIEDWPSGFFLQRFAVVLSRP
jgi:ubiquinone/menaquinone biosynthesis C-methylase UbiE